jgi:hypothetical protein
VTDTQVSTENGRKHAWLGIRLKNPRQSPPENVTHLIIAQDAQDTHPIFNYYFNYLEKVGILVNNRKLPVQMVTHEELLEPPAPTVSDLQRRLWEAFGANPFKPSQLSQHFTDEELARLVTVMADMEQRGELMEVPLEGGDRAWRLVG